MELSGRVSHLPVGQRDLLARLARDGAEGVFPLSSAQQRIWLVERFGSAGHTFAGPVVARVEGRLDHDVLERTIAAIIRRHEILRSVFPMLGDGPVQVLMPPPTSVSVPVEEITTAEVDAAVQEEMRRPFDLARGPLLRYRLFQLGDRDRILMFTAHHIVFDDASSEILLADLAALYAASLEGEPDPLPSLPVQYPDYAVWQREQLRSKRYDRELDYWLRQLRDAPAVLDIATDHRREPTDENEAVVADFLWSQEVLAAMTKLTVSSGATVFMALLGVFACVLGRRSDQTDIVIGTPMAGRGRAELRGLIGVYLNMISLRVDVTGDPTFRELLERARDTALGAYAHQEVPFEKLVEELNPERVPGRHPLFQAVLVLWDVRRTRFEVPGAVLNRIPLTTGTVQNDVALICGLEPDGLRAELRCPKTLFESETVRELAEEVRTLLCAVIADPDVPISRLHTMASRQSEGNRL
jgi:hypothetical protein